MARNIVSNITRRATAATRMRSSKATLLPLVVVAMACAIAISGCDVFGLTDDDSGGGTTTYPYVCENGTPADGTTDTANVNKCASCNDGFTRSGDNCVAEATMHDYVCANGTPASGKAPTANITKCKPDECDSGYVFNSTTEACVGSGIRNSAKEFNLANGNDKPQGVWSDGTTMWIADYLDNNIYAYTLATGTRDSAQEFNLTGGNDNPWGIWSDGNTMWVVDHDDDKTYAYTLATGARDTTKEFDLASDTDKPRGIWSDGTTIWMADWADAKLYAYTLSTGARDTANEYNTASDNDNPHAVWSDGTTMWIADDFYDKAFAYTLSSGARDTSKEFDFHTDNADPTGIWSDGTTLWVADDADDTLYAYTLTNGTRNTTKEFNLNSANGNPTGMWGDGTTLWVADSTDDKLYAYTLASKSRDTAQEFDLDSSNGAAQGIWSDGDTMYVVDSTADKVFAYTVDTVDNTTYTYTCSNGTANSGSTYDSSGRENCDSCTTGYSLTDSNTCEEDTSFPDWSRTYFTNISNDFLAVEYANGLFLVAGENGQVIQSADGDTNWSGGTYGSNNINDIAFGNNTWTLVRDASTNQFVTSTSILQRTGNSGNFTTATVDSNTKRTLTAVVYGSTFVVGGDNTSSIFSYNNALSSWLSAATVGSIFSFSYSSPSIVYDGSKYVGINSFGRIHTSSNGRDWSTTSISALSSFDKIVYANDMYLALGPNGRIATSSDASSWTVRTDSNVTTQRLRSAAYHDGVWIIVGGTSTTDAVILASDDNGVTWSVQTIPFGTERINDIVYGNGRWLAVTDGGAYLTGQ